jgi:hypothetical protein
MNYQDYNYSTEADSAHTPPGASQMVAAPTTDAQIYPLSPNPVIVQAPQPSNTSEMLMLGSMMRSMQNSQNQQIYLMRDLDVRLARLEGTAQATIAVQPATFERITWWAIWGLLMLILGGALTIVIMLILLNVEVR